ncbi:MAG TPA: glycosyltransferase family 87 protein [Polyangia bacterium]|nr:glycosyltransferase family 87 protein [Polyangia bacterium]
MISGAKRVAGCWLAAASIATAVGAAALAFHLAHGERPFVFWTYNRDSQPFELLGLFGGLTLVAATWLRAHRRPLDDALPSLVAGAVGLAWLGYVAENWEQSYDWRCYRAAAEQLAAGGDAYGGCYLYPPLLAQALAGASRLLARVVGPDETWLAVFFAWQAAQIALVIAAAAASVRLVERLRVPRRRACAYVAIAFLVDAPLLRTLRHNQVNLWVLDLILFALVAHEAWPLAAGAALALAGHVKLYPFALGLAFLLCRRWRVLAGAIIGAFAVLGLELAAGGAAAWRAYLAFVPRFPGGTLMRDNGLHSFVFNSCRLAGCPRAVPYLWIALVLAVSALIARRLQRRQRALPVEDPARLYGHAADLLAWTLLVSPMVWEHHYLLAVPALLIYASLAPRASLPRLAIAAALMLAMPTSDFYPLGYHRLAGLALLLAWTDPTSSTAS